LVMADPETEGLALMHHLNGNLSKKEAIALIIEVVKFRCKPLKKVLDRHYCDFFTNIHTDERRKSGHQIFAAASGVRPRSLRSVSKYENHIHGETSESNYELVAQNESRRSLGRLL